MLEPSRSLRVAVVANRKHSVEVGPDAPSDALAEYDAEETKRTQTKTGRARGQTTKATGPHIAGRLPCWRVGLPHRSRLLVCTVRKLYRRIVEGAPILPVAEELGR